MSNLLTTLLVGRRSAVAAIVLVEMCTGCSPASAAGRSSPPTWPARHTGRSWPPSRSSPCSRRSGPRPGISPAAAACCTRWSSCVIAAFAWLVAALVLVLEDVALARWRTDVPDNLGAAGSRPRW